MYTKSIHKTNKEKRQEPEKQPKNHSYPQLRLSRISSIDKIPKSSETFVHSKKALMVVYGTFVKLVSGC